MITNMDMVSLRGLMDVGMLDIGLRAGSMALASTASHLTTKSNTAFGKMAK